MDCSTPGFPVLHHLLEFARTHVHWVGDTIQLSHPLSCPYPHALHLSQHQGLFQSVSSSNQVAKILKLQLQNQSFQWISGLISFRVDWFGLLAFKGTLKSLLQHNSKASILQPSAFFMVQLSQAYMTTGKTIASTKLTFVGKVMSLIFSKLSRFVIAFLPLWFLPSELSQGSEEKLQSELLLPLPQLGDLFPRRGDGCGGDWCTLIPKSLFQVNSWNLL